MGLECVRAKMRVIVAGYYGFGNGGDEALLLSVLQMLPAKAEPIVLSQRPLHTEQQYGVKAIDRWNGWQVLRLLRSADVFIWGGGSLMQDSSSWRNPLYYGGLMGLAQLLGLRTVAWAQGIGPLQWRWTRWLARHCLQGCTAVSVRDRASAALLDRWNISYTLAPDPVWALAAKDYSSTWPELAIAIVLRTHPLLTCERLAVLQQALVQLQVATKAHLVLMPFQSSDLGIAQQLHAAMSSTAQIVCVDDPRQLKGALRQVELAIAMRLHGLILAAAEGVPVFGLSYDPKVTQLLEEQNLPGYELSDLPTDPAEIARNWLAQFGQQGLDGERREALQQRALLHQQVLERVCSASSVSDE